MGFSGSDEDIWEIPTSIYMFSCTHESLKQALSSYDDCVAPEMQMAATKPEINRPIPHMMPQTRIGIQEIETLHLLFRLEWWLPEDSVVLVISLQPIEIFKKFHCLHLCFRLCPCQISKYDDYWLDRTKKHSCNHLLCNVLNVLFGYFVNALLLIHKKID